MGKQEARGSIGLRWGASYGKSLLPHEESNPLCFKPLLGLCPEEGQWTLLSVHVPF